MIKKSNLKKIISFILIIITMLSVAQPIFATSGTGKWVGGQFASYIKTTDNADTKYGVLLRRLVNYTTNESRTVFCAEHGIDFDTGTIYNGEYYTPVNSKLRKACKIAYLGWYKKHGDYVVNGGTSDANKKQYVLTQQFIWETLGQSSATFIDSGIQAEYVSFKNNIENQIKQMEKRPSFDGDTITVQAGESKKINDTNKVLSSYPDLDKTTNGIRVQHSSGSNSMTISVDENTNLENYTITDADFKSWGMIKNGTEDEDSMVFFEFEDGVQNQLYSMAYNDPVTLSISVEIKLYGKLELTKLNTNGDLVDGAVFNVTGPNGYNKDVTVKDGKITLNNLAKGDYYIKEKSSPTGYLLNTETYKATIEANKTIKQAIVNDEPTGNITVTKTNSNGDKVQGAKFTIKASENIYNKAGTAKYYTKGDTVATITTDSTGVASKTGLPLGKYIVQEKEVPEGYLLNSEEKTVTLKYKDQNTKVVYENVTIKNDEPTGELSLVKTDSDTGNEKRVDGAYHHGDASIEGAVYTLYADEDIYNKAKTVKYFSKDEAIATFTFDEKGNATVKIINSNTKAEIKVSGNKITGMPMGSYRYYETSVPQGYTQDTNVYKHTFTYKDSKTKTITLSGTVSNTVEKAPFEVIKVTTNNNTIADYVEGAEFTAILTKYVDYYGSFEEALKHLDEYAEDEYSAFKTGSDGHGISGLLAYGNYTVNETYTPSSEIETVEEFYVTINKDSKTPVKEMVANDLPFEAYIKLVKQDKKTGKNVTFSNTTFSLYKLNEDTNEWERVSCKVGKEYHDSWTTDSEGIARTETKLEAGRYKVDEIVVANNFLQLDEELIFDVNNKNETLNYDEDLDAWITVIVQNEQPTGTLVIDKSVALKENVDTSLVNISDLSKIKFKLVAKENIIDYADGSTIYEAGTEIGEYSISKDGDLTISDLPMGTYEFYEVETLDGLVLDETKYEVKFTAEDTTTKVYTDIREVINDTTYVEISKQNIAGEEIEGAKLQVIDENGNIVEEWISTKTPHFIEGLLVNKTYTLHEELSVGEYVKATDIKFTVNNTKETQKITMIDKIVEITKTDLTTGEELEGAELTVIDKETGETVDKWTSTKEPHKVVGLEENKTYILEEITCPYGYEQAESIEFTVSSDKEIQKIEMKDMPILKDIKVIKIDSETKEVIKDKFTFGIYEDPECTKLIKEVESNKKDGTVLFEDLRYNTYYIKEITSPNDYELSDRVVKVEINDKGIFVDDEQVEEKDDTIEFTFENKKIEVPKTGDESKVKLLVGAILLSLLGIAYIVVRNHNKNKQN